MFGKLIRLVLILSMVLSVIFSSSLVLDAYDFGAKHPDINKDVNVSETKARLWKSIRAWGFSEEATAGLMGNIYAECGYNYTRVEVGRGATTMANFEYGKYGLGLIQWTYPTRQKGLFAVCDRMKVQWTDLDAQIVRLKEELWSGTWWKYGGNFSSLKAFMACDDVKTATDVICWGFERPKKAVAHLDRRRAEAKKVLKEFAGTSIKPGNTGSSGNGSKNETAEEEIRVVNASLIIDEWDLEGMPSKIVFDGDEVKLPTYEDLSSSERYSLFLIKDSLVEEKEVSVYNFIRTFVAFLGLCTIVYSVLLMVAYLFDRTNNILEISLVRVVTFGRMGYTDEVEYENIEGYMGKNRIIKVSLLCTVVGFVIVSGAVFSWVSSVLYWLMDRGFIG